MTLSFLWLAIIGAAKKTMRAWRLGVVVVLLLLVIVAGCDVRPFSEFSGDDSSSEESSEEGDGDGTDGTASLQLSTTPPAIETSVNMSGTTQIEVENSEEGQMFMFAVTTDPTNGEAVINAEGLLTYTPDTDSTESDRLVVTVTDDSDSTRSGTIEIDITVNPS